MNIDGSPTEAVATSHWPRPITRRRFLHGAVALGGSALLGDTLAACGSSSSANTQTGKSTLYVANFGDMQNLDPFTTSNDQVTNEMQTNLYALPLTFKVPGFTSNGVPYANPNVFMGDAALGWQWNPARTEITFTLRPGIRFPDGTPLNAQAVKYSLDRCFELQAVGYFLFTMVGVTKKSQVRVVDDRHFKFVLPAPASLLLGNMAQFYGTAIINPTVVKQHAPASDPLAKTWLKTNVAGSGSYVLQNWNVGSGWTLAANPHAWSPPKTKTVQFRIVPDAQERELLVRSGTVDLALGIPVKDVAQLQSDSALRVVSAPTRIVGFAGFNVLKKPFDNTLVRQALSYAVPYQTIMQQVMKGQGIQLKSPIPQGMPTSDFSFWRYDTDYSKAKQMLAQAGYPSGFSTTLDVAIGTPTDEQTALWIQQGFQQAGVHVQVNTMPSAAFNTKLQAHQHDFFISTNWVSINNDPFYHLFWLFAQSCCTYGNYMERQIVDLVNKWVNKPTDDPGRIAASKQAQKIIVDAAPWIFLYQPPQITVMRKNVQGYTFYSADDFIRYGQLYKT